MNTLTETDTLVAISLGDTLRELMTKRGLSGVDLAAQVDLSPTSLSQILTGQTKPRQSTFNRLVLRLAETPEERLNLVQAYAGEGADESDVKGLVREPEPPPYGVGEPEGGDAPAHVTPAPEEVAARYMEAKSASIAFEADVAALLQESKIPVIHPFISEKATCDFVTKTKTKIALECKTGLSKDWERVLGTCLLLKKNLPADEVVVVIPYHNQNSRRFVRDFADHGIYIETFPALVERLKKLGA